MGADPAGVRALPLALLLSCAAAADGPRPDTGGEAAEAPLLPVDGWRPLDADAGPFPDPPAAEVYCSELAWRVEQRAWQTPMFEVRSDLCLWGVYGQPLAADLAAAEGLALTFAWGETWAASPTDATVSLAVDDELLWSQTFPVPGPAGEIELLLPVAEAHAAGAGATLLVSNHGTNTWALSAGHRAAPAAAR